MMKYDKIFAQYILRMLRSVEVVKGPLTNQTIFMNLVELD